MENLYNFYLKLTWLILCNQLRPVIKVTTLH